MSPEFNFEPLSPVSFLKRAGRVHADKIAVIDDGKETTYRDLLTRSEKLAGALQGLGVAGQAQGPAGRGQRHLADR